MARSIIAETSLENLRPVGVDQRRTLDAWDQITSYIARDERLGPRHAAFFAEPVTGSRGRVEWYSPIDSDEVARPFDQLSETERAAALAEAGRLKAEISARIEELRAGSSPEEKRVADTLASALLIPESRPDSLYLVGDQPVLVNWGMLDDRPNSRIGVLDEVLRPAAAPVAAAPVVAAIVAPPRLLRRVRRTVVDRRWGWWNLLWLVFFALVAALLVWLLWGCALGVPLGRPFLSYCPIGSRTSDAMADLKTREVDLRAEIDALERARLEKPPCPAAPPPAPPPPPPPEAKPTPPVDRSEFDHRRSDARGRTGKVTVTLIWDGDTDLDLIAVCPDGAAITFKHRSGCGGTLDVDANSRGHMMAKPVENIRWTDGPMTPGTYQVIVNNFDGRSAHGSPVPFRVLVQNGSDVKEYSGALGEDRPPTKIAEFTIE